MVAKVIVNPYAGRWRARALIDELEKALKSAGIKYELTQSERPKHPEELAYLAVKSGYRPIIAAGGDGTISEIVNGCIEALGLESGIGHLPPIGIMPLGSANDLVVNLGLSTDLFDAAAVIAKGEFRYLDLGIVNGRYFDNNSAIGLEPTITLIQQRIMGISGVVRYVLATLIGILKNPKWIVTMEWDAGRYHGPVTLVTVGNNPLTGGVFYMTPHADPFDGLLTFTFGFIPSRRRMVGILPRTMKSGYGSYVELPEIQEINTSWLNIHTESPTPLHADGEIQSEAINTIEYKIISKALPILVPG